jgi:hypothetical protein
MQHLCRSEAGPARPALITPTGAVKTLFVTYSVTKRVRTALPLVSCELAPGPTGLGAVSFPGAVQAGHGRADAAIGGVVERPGADERVNGRRAERGPEVLSNSQSEAGVMNPRAEKGEAVRTLVVTSGPGRVAANLALGSAVGANLQGEPGGPPRVCPLP